MKHQREAAGKSDAILSEQSSAATFIASLARATLAPILGVSGVVLNSRASSLAKGDFYFMAINPGGEVHPNLERVLCSMALDPLLVNENFLPQGHLAQGMCNAVVDPELALVVWGVEVRLVETPVILRIPFAPEGF